MYSCLENLLFFKERFFETMSCKNSEISSLPSIPVLYGDVILPLSVKNETKGTGFNWYIHQNRKVDKF